MTVISEPRRRSMWGSGLAAALSLIAGLALAGGDAAAASKASRAYALKPVRSAALEQTILAVQPITGVPVNTGDDILHKIHFLAADKGLHLTVRIDDPATYIVKGYVSAVGGASDTNLLFVFEVFDNSGQRVHRIIGHETAPQGTGDPWSEVDSGTTSHLAARAVEGLKAWVTRPGS